jgi:phage/plasmid-associated DNA primase
MDASLQNLINKVAEKKTSKTKGYGLTCMNAPPNLWCFKDDNCRQFFWQEFCKLVSTGSEGKNYFLAEVNEESAFIVELNFRFIDSDTVRHEDGPFNEEFICDLIECVSRVLQTNLNISEDKRELICCVLQSKKVFSDPETPDEVKYTLRLQYPFCRTKVDIQKQALRDLVIKELMVKGPKLDQSAYGDWSQRYDSAIPASYVPLYGSKRKASEEQLELTNIFGFERDEYGLYNELELSSVFDPRNHSDVQMGRIDKEIFDDDEAEIEKWLPLFLSPIYWPSVCKMVQKQESPSQISQESLNLVLPNEEPRTPMDFIKIFIEMLKPERKNDMTSWMDVGKAFYHATFGNIDGLEEWKKYTEGSTKFKQEMCEIKYPLFRESLVTYKTIAWHAIRDSPETYKAWNDKWVYASMEKAMKEPLHTAIAEMFYRKHWLYFAYASNGKKGGGRTYRFDKNGHRWRQLEDGDIIIGQILTNKFLPDFEREKIKVHKKLLDIEDSDIVLKKKRNGKEQRNSRDENEERDEMELVYKNILKIITMIGNTPQKKCIITGCQEKLFIENFDKNLDTNPMLIGVLNGVIEVDTKDSQFRPGKPEDYLSMYTSLPYREDFNWECDSVKRYLNYLNQVFPDRDLMKYMRKDIASFLKGRNAEKLFRIFSGCGNNSKSVYIKLLERAFGNYCVSVPVSVITVKRGSSSSASPETARLRGTHIATCAEPDDNETIKAGIVKSMTGNDRFFTRALFSNGEEIEAMYKLILITNKVPAIPNAGKAIKNRVMIIPFLATFVDKDYPEDEDEQYRTKTFKMDPDFDDYVPFLSQAMLWCAVQDYKTYCQEGLKHFPKVIVDETNSYWEENDAYDLFIREKLIKEVIPEAVEEDAQRMEFIPDVIIEPLDEQVTGQVQEVVKMKKSPKKMAKKDPKFTTEVLMTELYKVFKLWVKEAFPGLAPIPSQAQVRAEMEQRLGPQKNRKWLGWSLKEEELNKF